VAEIPVRCIRAPGQAHSATAVAAWREVSEGNWEAQLGAGERKVKGLVRDHFRCSRGTAGAGHGSIAV
jgi:hypothetical protein